jgi:peptide/nickel transport system substrate-binding protein
MKIWKFFTWVLLMSVVLTACGGTPTEKITEKIVEQTVIVAGTPEVQVVTATPAPLDKSGGTFVWGVIGDIPGLNPMLNNNADDIRIYNMTSEPLSWGGEDYPSDWKPILAESWERSSDGLTWTVHLRKGVKWHDGTPFTADDVLYWAQALQDEKTLGAGWMRARFYIDGKPYKFEKVDDLTVKITSAKPVPSLIGDICDPLAPKHYFVDNNIANADMAKDKSNTDGAIGTGPFMYQEYKKGEAVILTRFDDYWGGKPYLDSVVFRILPEMSSRINALKTGEIDFARIEPKYVAELLAAGTLEIKVIDVDMEDQFWFNVGKPFLKDKRTRQALVYALDREAMLQATYMGYGRVADSPFTPFTSAYEPLPQYEFNPEKSKQLLEEVGWVMGSDGVYVADNVDGVTKGTRFTLTIDAVTTEVQEQKPDVMAQSFWKDIGIDVTIRQMDSNVWSTQNVGMADKQYDVYWAGVGFLGANAGNYTWEMATDVANSPMSYSNPQILDLFAQAKTNEDPKARDELYKQAAKIFWDEVPAINLYYSQRVYAFNKRVHYDEAGFNAGLVGLFELPGKIWVDKQ